MSKIIKCPTWLKDRMKNINHISPTLDKVQQQMTASAKWQNEYGFSCVEKIKKSNYIR